MKAITTAVRRCEFVRGAWFDAAPEQCDDDAEPGSPYCYAHGDDNDWEEPEDTHDYYED